MPRLQNLSTKLGLGAASIVLTTLLAAGILISGMTKISQELLVTQLADTQIKNFSALASQIDVFAISSANAGVQSTDEREASFARFRAPVDRTFHSIKGTLEASVEAAQGLGEDEQARRATQSLTVARMEAQFDRLWSGLSGRPTDKDGVLLQLNVFSTQMTPLLTNAIGEEQRRRDNAIREVEELKSRLNLYAQLIVLSSILILLLYYFGLVRPQFARLQALQNAAREIGQENFATRLPDTRDDEIGRVMIETNAMSEKLAEQRDAISRDAQRLKDIIADRTKELQSANVALEQRDIDRRRFFADISHEMRTPLTVILTEAELAGAEGGDGGASFDVIQNRAKRLSRRIDDLLRVARSETGQISLETEDFALDAAARDAIEEMQNRVDRVGLKIVAELETAPAIGDKNWMRQIIGGFIENSLRHSGGDVITVATRRTEHAVMVEVGDNGKGFSDPDAVFERFTKDEESPGFGIGLALAKWVVEQQGGTIRISEGLHSVIVELPRSAEGAA